MRAWRVVGKYPILDGTGEVANTAIQLVATAGGEGGFTEVVIGDHTGKPDEELIELAREAFFKSEFSDRAMAESVQKIDLLEQATKQASLTMKEIEEQFKRAETERNERFSQLETEAGEIQSALLEFMTEQVPLLMSLMPLLSMVENQEEGTNDNTEETSQ